MINLIVINLSMVFISICNDIYRRKIVTRALLGQERLSQYLMSTSQEETKTEKCVRWIIFKTKTKTEKCARWTIFKTKTKNKTRKCERWTLFQTRLKDLRGQSHFLKICDAMAN